MSQHYHYPQRQEFAKRLVAKPVPASLKTLSLVAALVGVAVFAFGLFTNPDRAWQALHFNWLYFASVSTAGVAFAAIQRIVTARWSRPVIRFAEGFVAFVPVAFVILLAILLFSGDHIFTWAGREAVPTVEKATYLNPTFFLIRGIFFFGLMTVLQLLFVWHSVKMDVAVMPEYGAKWAAGLRAKMRAAWTGDERRELHSQHSLQGKLAVAVCIAFPIGWCFMAWDYSMSISLHFQQTMYAWIFFMGAWVNMIMLTALLSMWWRKHLDAPDLVTMDHFWDLGKLGFAFTAFIGYISFSQYLVIWYGNLPEETHFYRLRLSGVWKTMTTLIPIFGFVLPFFGLISKAAKLYLPTFVLFAVCSMIGIYLHRYIEIYPSIYGEATSLPFGLLEIGQTVGFIGLWAFSYFAFMDAFPVMRVFMMTTPFKDEVQVPVNPKTMEPLPAHE
ncbi:hypothetical protein [Gemmatimonas aurantiaca]|uniref:hypothetical protein n=1 Tax=Gemmatimonas aurantiaca TaxID=173480 RepID=UPI00301B9C6D